MGYYENKNKCKNFFRNKNKFVHLEKDMLISAPDSEYNYFPYLTNPYYNDLCVNLKCIPALKKIRSINVYIIKLFWETIFNTSLGITSKYFSKSKKFLKSKSSYLFSASYIRRFLTYLRIEDLTLLIRKIPIYLKDIIRIILSPTNVLYKNPFLGGIVNEKKLRINFTF